MDDVARRESQKQGDTMKTIQQHNDAVDTGDLVNDPLYNALDNLYARGWRDSHQKRHYDPRGTKEWQSVLDIFRIKTKNNTGTP
jgi:hypothetical protein